LLISIIDETLESINSSSEFSSLSSTASTLITRIGSVFDLRAKYQPICSPFSLLKRTLTPSIVDAS
jgi:hypothetical protein